MNLTQLIHRNSVYVFFGMLAFAVWAFWATYFAVDIVLPMEHVHGIAMFAWCCLLISQAGLIRVGRRDLHRQAGRLSYFLVPVIALSTLLLAHDKITLRGVEGPGPLILCLQLLLLVQFLAIYWLAIRNRRTPDVHARYMVATVFPMIDPIFNRILSIPLAAHWPILEELALPITFGATLLLVLTLIVVDWRSGYGKPVFLRSLAVVIPTQAAILALLVSPAYMNLWRQIASWYAGLPFP